MTSPAMEVDVFDRTKWQREYSAKKVLANREQYWQLKNGPCADCGLKFHPVAMDFDHRDQDDKSYAIGQMLRSYPWDAIAAEIAKCDLVCANCHRMRTYRKKQYRYRKTDRQAVATDDS